MDLSKLPKLSQTPQRTDAPGAPDASTSPAPGAPVAAHCGACGAPLRAGARFCDACGAQLQPDYSSASSAATGSAADIWISAIIGLIFLMIGRSFGAYLVSLITHQPYHTGVNWTSGDLAGTEVGYPDLTGFVIWTDSAMFLFGLALLLDALALIAARMSPRIAKPLLSLTLVIVFAAAVYNAIVAIKLFSNDILPITSLLCLAVAGYVFFQHWSQLKASRT